MQQRITKTVISFTVTTFIAFLLMPIHSIYAEITDGFYEIDYEVLNANNDSVSVANDYFDKPAVLVVEDGSQTVQMSINHSEWVVGLQAPQEDDFVDVDVISQDDAEDTRIVEFAIEDDHDFADPIEMKMHIIVDVLDEDYDHHYTALFAFYSDSMQEVPEAETEEPTDAETEETEDSTDETVEEAEDNENMEEEPPQIGDEEVEDITEEVAPSGINAGTLIVIVLLAAITIILLYAFVFKRKNKDS